MIHLDVIQALEIALYIVIVLLFIVTGILNVKDLETMRHDKWTRQDSVALIIRTLFYAFLVNFLLILAVEGGILLFVVLWTSTSIQRILPSTVISLQISFGLLLTIGLIYGLARWKEWYDLMDAEY